MRMMTAFFCPMIQVGSSMSKVIKERCARSCYREMYKGGYEKLLQRDVQRWVDYP